MNSRDAVITGIGLVSCLGAGMDAHFSALSASGRSGMDASSFAPYPIHAMPPLDLDTQIPKKGDQRQMEPWQRIGVYAAGLALQNAGVKGEKELLQQTHMIVAAGGGERDYAADSAILAGMAMASAQDKGRFLNERLMSDLRPTLFLAQLSNLLAGNISIVHGVVGSSRTFMGEELAGVDAVRIAQARIAARQGDLFLVGGSYNAERPDTLLLYELGHLLYKGAPQPVWARQKDGGGMILGSVGAFLVIEARDHARARGAKPLARLHAPLTDRCDRKTVRSRDLAQRQWQHFQPLCDTASTAILSGASGAAQPTQQELAFLQTLDLPYRATASALGHSLEASFPASLALAAHAVSQGRLFDPLEDAETPASGVDKILITSWGHWRGEGMALVEAA